MTKEELIKIIIRIAGLIFLVLAIIELPKLFNNTFFYLYYIGAFDQSVTSTTYSTEIAKEWTEVTTKTMRTQISSSTTKIVTYLIASWYLFKRGKFVFNLLSK